MSVPDISRKNNSDNIYYSRYFRCFHEHLDMFTEIEKPDSQPLIETPFGGRFCGNNAPRERISLYQSLSLVFLTDRWKAGLLLINQVDDLFLRTNVTETRFIGSYEFISDEKYTRIGVADGQAYGKDSLCTFTIYGNKYKGRNNKTGELFSPTYPGEWDAVTVYCSFDFIQICTLPRMCSVSLSSEVKLFTFCHINWNWQNANSHTILNFIFWHFKFSISIYYRI